LLPKKISTAKNKALNFQEISVKSQKHNQGELKEIKVKIEKDVAESLEVMSKNSNISVDDLVVIALKRFRSSHADYMKLTKFQD
jgi:fructose-1,6-bisphosphatase/sedoheptulose 1,7-bisphosphatase-like protein